MFSNRDFLASNGYVQNLRAAGVKCMCGGPKKSPHHDYSADYSPPRPEINMRILDLAEYTVLL